mmetsp:Transcript_23472/g.32920  ORF Transcript_23472/g.32920 Transcript_23472/m.32920 type:complete len:187 (-) Transcript_23472:148-708(-)
MIQKSFSDDNNSVSTTISVSTEESPNKTFSPTSCIRKSLTIDRRPAKTVTFLESVVVHHIPAASRRRKVGYYHNIHVNDSRQPETICCYEPEDNFSARTTIKSAQYKNSNRKWEYRNRMIHQQQQQQQARLKYHHQEQIIRSRKMQFGNHHHEQHRMIMEPHKMMQQTFNLQQQFLLIMSAQQRMN